MVMMHGQTPPSRENVTSTNAPLDIPGYALLRRERTHPLGIVQLMGDKAKRMEANRRNHQHIRMFVSVYLCFLIKLRQSAMHSPVWTRNIFIACPTYCSLHLTPYLKLKKQTNKKTEDKCFFNYFLVFSIQNKIPSKFSVAYLRDQFAYFLPCSVVCKFLLITKHYDNLLRLFYFMLQKSALNTPPNWMPL